METFKVICIAVVVFVLVVGAMWLKVDAYGGDTSCLFIKCVKVIK